MKFKELFSIICFLLFFCSCKPVFSDSKASEYFSIHVVDAETGRGVPMIQLSTVNNVTYLTDSNGFIAFYEPGLMGENIFFHIKGHGYSFPKDGFGYRGKKIQVTKGGSCKIRIRRINLAERLYRITGQGIYRDSVLLGEKTPLEKPLLNGGVMGQDTVMAIPFKGKIYWFWGDTNCTFYPLGNFAVSGAVSDPMGLDPESGVDLKYFTGRNGFSKKMCPRPGPGPVWLEGLMKLTDAMGKERIYVNLMRMKNLGTVLERGLALFDEKKELFEKCVDFDLSAQLYPRGHPFKYKSNGVEYYYFGHPHPSPFPNVRVRAELKYVSDPACYETFTCFAPGARFDSRDPEIERDSHGRLIYGWKINGAPVNTRRQLELVKAGHISQQEGWLQLQDVKTGKLIQAHAGSVFWNQYRGKWVLIAEQTGGGPSLIGELWYGESDTMTGPWVYAIKIVTHDDYSFYNPAQHPFFDKDGGRRIYFEGTYTRTFSSGKNPETPRYDYNQIMYGLSLDKPELFLPCPVYCVKATPKESRKENKAPEGNSLMFAEEVEALELWKKVLDIPFFAFPPDRKKKDLIPVYENGGAETESISKAESNLKLNPLFYALPVSDFSESLPVVFLYRYKNNETGRSFFSIQKDLDSASFVRSSRPVCCVWKNPMTPVMIRGD